MLGNAWIDLDPQKKTMPKKQDGDCKISRCVDRHQIFFFFFKFLPLKPESWTGLSHCTVGDFTEKALGLFERRSGALQALSVHD